MAVTHHLSSQDNRNGSYQLLIKTPSHRGPTSMGIGPMSRKANRTGGLKTPRTFSIYTDGENQMARGGGDTFDMEEPQKLFSKADLPSLANPPRSAANKMLNPLADKTNTVKKSRSRNNAGTQSPTPAKKSSASIKPNSILKTSLSSKAVKDLGQATPHLKKSVRLQPPNWNGFNKEPDSVQRLLYRTPVTSKRAHRPPVAFDTSLEISEETDEYNETSLVGYSDRLGGLSFSLGDQDMPDAEYGPPTALGKL
ncbi:hypothetical protein BY996DRAFT_7143885 [Phakopsora pachyrhizi]|nr:hypothetical protein BY996DRAFT_7143885 [Phakopsora pachyrhizi]